MPMRTFTRTLPNVLTRHVISFACIPWPLPFSSPFFDLSFSFFFPRFSSGTPRPPTASSVQQQPQLYSSLQQHLHTAAPAYSSGSLPQPPPTSAAAVRCRHTKAVYSSSLPSLSSSDHPLTVLSPLPPIHAPPWG